MTRCNCPSVPMFHRQLKLSGRNITAAAPRQQAPEPPKGHLFQQSRWTRNLNLFHHRDYFIQITMDDDCAKGSLPTPRPKCNEGGSYLEISSGQKTILDLDAIFDSEHSQLRSKQCFVRPRCPNKKLPSKHPTHLQEMEETLTEEIAHDEAENFKPECSEVEEFKSAESGFRYLTIGGMRVLPVPVSGPMFWTDSK